VKTIFLAVVILIAVPAFAQSTKTFGGVQAPEAITLRITKVVNVDEPEHIVDEVVKSATGNTLTAESADVRYTLRCVVVHVLAHTWEGEQWDGFFPKTFRPVCRGYFHVGDRVVFYSLNNLVWLSRTITNGETFVHGTPWIPTYQQDKFWSFKAQITPAEFEWEKPYSIDSEEALPDEPRPAGAAHKKPSAVK
jgi:hypothetical protein